MFNVSANVSELNHDVGAKADCVLLVDGAQVDQSLGIWVDAGGTVTCAFTTKISVVGTHKLTVSATNVVPGDWDLANNTASTTIEIVPPIVKMAWVSDARSVAQRTSTSQSTHYSDCTYYWDCFWHDDLSTTNSDGRLYNFDFNSYSYDVPATSPLHIAFTATSGANSLANLNTDLGYPASAGCYAAYDASTRTWFDACNYGSYTAFSYNRHASSATYYSYGYSHYRVTYYYCDWYGCYPYTYGSDYSWSYGPVHWGSGVQFNLDGGAGVTAALTMTDANGTKYVAGGTYPLQPFSGGYTYGPYCYDYGYYYTYFQCYSGSYNWNGLLGYGSGYGNTNTP
jgi:hypothetical protein